MLTKKESKMFVRAYMGYTDKRNENIAIAAGIASLVLVLILPFIIGA